ncbi:MAG: hypothetical protein ACRDTV_21730, partial [Mycobacterium sp.]
AFTAALGEADEADSARVHAEVDGIDAELREHGVAAARAAALRDREMPTLQDALELVRAELGEPREPEAADPGEESEVASAVTVVADEAI